MCKFLEAVAVLLELVYTVSMQVEVAYIVCSACWLIGKDNPLKTLLMAFLLMCFLVVRNAGDQAASHGKGRSINRREKDNSKNSALISQVGVWRKGFFPTTV